MAIRNDDQAESSEDDDLYRILPRFVTKEFEYLEGYLLKPVQHEFKWQGKVCQLFITPAFVEDGDGQIKNFFPGLPEKQVEAALIELAVQDKNTFFDGKKTLVFTLIQLENRLAAGERHLNRKQISRSIQILAGTDYTIRGLENTLAFRLIETLAVVEEESEVRFIAYLGDLIAERIKKCKLNHN